MRKPAQVRIQNSSNDQSEPIDNLPELFVGEIESNEKEANSVIITQDKQSIPVLQTGEILIHGVIEGQNFIFNRLRRLALYGKLVDPTTKSQAFAEFSLVGPIGDADFGQSNEGGRDKLFFQFHYSQLSGGGDAARQYKQSSHTFFPPVVQMIATLKWKQLDKPADNRVRIALEIDFVDNIEGNKIKNQASEVHFTKPLEVILVWANTAALAQQTIRAATPTPPQAILAVPVLAEFPCAATRGPCPPNAQSALLRRLPLRFVNLSGAADIMALCQEQLKGVRDVWCDKTILTMQVVTPVPVNAENLVQAFGDFVYDDNDATMWIDFRDNSGLPSTDAIDVYVIKQLSKGVKEDPGGAVTFDAHKETAGVFLAKNKIDNGQNPQLLAHELGHVLGLDHPNLATMLDDGTVLLSGQINTVMQAQTPNLTTNSQINCTVFCSPILNPLAKVVQPLTQDCLRTDF